MGRGTETDATETDPQGGSPDSDALFDLLVEADVLAVEDGSVRMTEAFDDTLAIYHDTYVGVSEAEFHEAAAATFGLPDADAAAELLDEWEVSRTEYVCYLAVQSHLGPEVSPDDLAVMAGMVYEVVPDSPVPSALSDVTDDPEDFVAGRDRAVVSVWKRFCDPCEELVADLDAILDALPDDVAVAGIDGEVATAFCETHGVESAPGVVLFRDGERIRTVTGSDADAVVEALRVAYDD